jgi:hypothetical protein
VTSEKEKTELAKQWKIIDGSKLNSNLPQTNSENLAPKSSNLAPKTSNLTPKSSNLAPKNSNLPPKNSNLAPLLLSDENLPKLAPARLEEKHKVDDRHGATQKRHDVTKRRVVEDDCDESVCSECQSMCGSQCTCSEASVKM